MAGFDNEVLVAKNANYDPTNILTPGQPPYLGQINANGQIFIGSASAPFLRPGFITGSGGITITPGPGTINISGGASSTDLHVAAFIVNANGTSGTGANYATIGAAISAAILAGGNQTIFVMPGTYNENITMSPGVDITAFTCDSSLTRTNTSTMTGNVIINGKISASYNGRANISGVWITTNGDYAVEITGNTFTYVILKECTLIGVANSILHNTSSGGGWIGVNNCYFDLQTTGITHFVLSGGQSFLDVYYSKLFNTGNSTTASTAASGSNIFSTYSSYGCPVTTAGLLDSSYDLYAQALTLNSGAGINTVRWCYLTGGSSSALSVSGAATVCYLIDSAVSSSNTNAITGSGTLNFSNVSFISTSSLVNTTTQIAFITQKGAFKVALPAGDYTCLGTDEIVGATSSAARAITLMTSPSKGQKVTIKDVTGTASTHNITITPAAGNIDGSATAVINNAYGSLDLWYSGTQWFIS